MAACEETNFPVLYCGLRLPEHRKIRNEHAAPKGRVASRLKGHTNMTLGVWGFCGVGYFDSFYFPLLSPKIIQVSEKIWSSESQDLNIPFLLSSF